MKLLLIVLLVMCTGCPWDKPDTTNVYQPVTTPCLKEIPIAPVFVKLRVSNPITEEEAAEQIKLWYLDREAAMQYAAKWENSAAGCSVIPAKK